VFSKCLGKREDPTTPPTIDPSLKCSDPSPCKTSFDAVVHSSDGNTYFFKKPYFWTLDKYNRSLGGKRIIGQDFTLESRLLIQDVTERLSSLKEESKIFY
jgi:hypothetical protein